MEEEAIRLQLVHGDNITSIKIPSSMKIIDFVGYIKEKFGKDMVFETAHDFGYNFSLRSTIKSSGIREGEWIRIVYKRLCVKKPVIYLYPRERTEVTVKIESKIGISCAYPNLEEDGSWRVLCNPNGIIEDLKISGRTYPYLFWEAVSYSSCFNEGEKILEGFVVNRKDLVSFFEEKLEHIGLNSIESSGFISFWLPLMTKYQFYFIHFHFEDYHKAFPMIVDPAPDVIIRFLMSFRGINSLVDKEMKVLDQNLPSYERAGFTVVEWGGVEL